MKKTKKVTVKPHVRNGVAVPKHEREVEVTQADSLSDNLKKKLEEDKKKKVLDSLF